MVISLTRSAIDSLLRRFLFQFGTRCYADVNLRNFTVAIIVNESTGGRRCFRLPLARTISRTFDRRMHRYIRFIRSNSKANSWESYRVLRAERSRVTRSRCHNRLGCILRMIYIARDVYACVDTHQRIACPSSPSVYSISVHREISAKTEDQSSRGCFSHRKPARPSAKIFMPNVVQYIFKSLLPSFSFPFSFPRRSRTN